MSFTFRPRTYLLLLLFIGFLLYAKGLANGFIGDDDLQIIRNIKIHSIANIPHIFTGSTYESGGSDSMGGIFYRPLMMSIFSLIYAFSGPAPFLFHFVQLLFHLANTLLLFLFLRQFFKDKGAFLLSFLFLLHPINSEAVLYIANLQEVLFFFFGILALVLVQTKQLSKRQTIFIPLLLLLSLFAKESGIVFLILVPLYTYLFTKHKNLLKSFLISLPIVFGIYLFFRLGLAHIVTSNNSLAPIATLSLLYRLLNIPAIILYYLKILAFPLDLDIYQFWTITSFSFPGFWLPLTLITLFFSVLATFYFWLTKKHKKETAACIFFFLWFVLGLGLHLQILPLDATVADRWFYFPFVGITILIALLMKYIPLKKLPSKTITFTSLILPLLIILLFATRTFVRISDWQSNLTIYGHDLHSPSNFILENAYATALINTQQYDNAKYHAELSVKQHPYSANVNNLAIAYTGLHDIKHAKQHFQKALTYGHNFAVYENYANFLLYYENPQSALSFSQEALKLFPKSPHLWLVYGQTLYLQNQQDAALKAVATSYKIEPEEKTAEIFSTIQQKKPLNIK